MTLRPPAQVDETIKLLERSLCKTDIIRLAILQNWALKGYWPLVWCGSGVTAPLITEYTASTKSTDNLKQLLKYEGIRALPQNFIIEDPQRGLKAHLSSQHLKPLPQFQPHTHLPNMAIVNPSNAQARDTQDNDDSDTNIPQNNNDDNHESDTEEEVFFGGVEFAPIPPPANCNDDTVNDSSQNHDNDSVFLPDGVEPGLDGMGMFLLY